MNNEVAKCEFCARKRPAKTHDFGFGKVVICTECEQSMSRAIERKKKQEAEAIHDRSE